jgi:hypothetical protein
VKEKGIQQGKGELSWLIVGYVRYIRRESMTIHVLVVRWKGRKEEAGMVDSSC